VLEAFLNNKPLFYDKIDYERMPRVYASIKQKIKLPKIIHIVGTNGKGTTGRFLASALYSLGKSTGHYTSPHILKFNERIWLNGRDIDDDALNAAHTELLSLLSKNDANSLSYFEYTTLLGIVLFKECEYLVLEAGLGGQRDATAVFENILTIVVPIDKDHEAFLGTTINEIATTKILAVKTQLLVGKQPHKEVYTIAKKICDDKGLALHLYEENLDKEDELKVSSIQKSNNLEPYLVENLKLCISALKIIGLKYESQNLRKSRLFGRLSRISKNIIVDVGHNTLAAKSIFESLKEDKYTLVYNSYKDKNYKDILIILKEIIQSVAIIEIEDERRVPLHDLEKVLDDLNIKHTKFKKINREENYLVFGSFSVVEAFLKDYRE